MYIPKEELEKGGLLEPKPVQVNTPLEQLQAENERLKGELKQTEAQDQVVIDGLRNEIERLKYALKQRTAQSDANVNLWMKELKRGAVQEKEIEQLRKDNAKLKCLALHAMSEYFYLKAETYTDIEAGKYLKVMMLATKSREAYRKAKAKMMEGK